MNSRLGVALSVLGITGVGFLLASLVSSEAGGLLTNAAILLLIFGYAYLRGRGLAMVGLQHPVSIPRTLALGFGYFILATLLIRLLLEPGMEYLTGIHRDLSRFAYLKGNPPAVLRLLPVIWFNAAIFEEVYFRGFLIPSIAEVIGFGKIGWIISISISTLFFAALHSYQGAVGFIVTGTGALFLAAIFLAHNRNLWISILTHGLFDTSAMLLMFLGRYSEVTHILLPQSY